MQDGQKVHFYIAKVQSCTISIAIKNHGNIFSILQHHATTIGESKTNIETLRKIL